MEEQTEQLEVERVPIDTWVKRYRSVSQYRRDVPRMERNGWVDEDSDDDCYVPGRARGFASVFLFAAGVMLGPVTAFLAAFLAVVHGPLRHRDQLEVEWVCYADGLRRVRERQQASTLHWNAYRKQYGMGMGIGALLPLDVLLVGILLTLQTIWRASKHTQEWNTLCQKHPVVFNPLGRVVAPLPRYVRLRQRLVGN